MSNNRPGKAELVAALGDPNVDAWPLHEGLTLVWEPDPWWRVPARVGYGCRFVVGPRYARCPAPAVAEFDRGRQWWAYCAEHLYGRRLHDGVVYGRVARPVGS